MTQCQRSRGEDVGWRRRITLAGQDVEHDIGGMNAVSDRLGAGCFDGRQAVGQNRVEDVDHLPIAIVGTGELAPYTFDRSRKHPVLEGSAVAQRSGFASQHRHVMPGIVDGIAAAERASMLGNDASVLADHNAVGVGMNLYRPPDSAGRDRVFIVVEPHQAGLRDRCRHRVESVEPAGIGNELRSLGFEHLPDRLFGQFWMPVRLGVGDALVQQPRVQLIEGFEPQPRREEAFTNQPDLVLDLALLPARRWRAGNRIDQVVAAHLHEAAIVETPFADEDRLHGGLHVVVDAAHAGALEQSECPVVGVEHHLLCLARIAPHKQHPAVTEPDMGGLHDHRYAIEQDDFMAPVELIGFSRRKAQRDVGRSRRLPALLAPPSGVTAHGVVTAVIAAPAELLEDPDQRQLLASGLGRIPCQQPVEFCCPSAQLRSRLDNTLVLE